MDYQITSLKVKDDVVKMVIETAITKSFFTIRLNDYLDYNFKVNQYLSEEQMDVLEKLHTICFAYNKCLNKLARKDLTLKEVKDVLKQIDLEDKDRDNIIDKLIALGLINDEQLTSNAFELGQSKGVGKRKTAAKLKERGVNEQTISKYFLEQDNNVEIENGKTLASLYYKSLSNVSFNQAKLKVRNKLRMEGFSDNISEIISGIDLPFNQQNQYNSLCNYYQKALRSYQNKYKGKELKNHIFNYLYAKGFTSSEIIEKLEKEANRSED